MVAVIVAVCVCMRERGRERGGERERVTLFLESLMEGVLEDICFMKNERL